jgi:hypothetical protein
MILSEVSESGRLRSFETFAREHLRRRKMRLVECKISRSDDLSGAEELIEDICARRGLQLSMKGSLSTHPGSIHWHYKRPRQKGTLEVTLLVAAKRIWFQVQAGRRAAWINDELPLIRHEIDKGRRPRSKMLRGQS